MLLARLHSHLKDQLGKNLEFIFLQLLHLLHLVCSKPAVEKDRESLLFKSLTLEKVFKKSHLIRSGTPEIISILPTSKSTD